MCWPCQTAGFFHNKDLPPVPAASLLAHAGGSNDRSLETPFSKVEVALCWECCPFMTARRLARARVDYMVGGSAGGPCRRNGCPDFPRRLHDTNHHRKETNHSPVCPVSGFRWCAAHAGDFEIRPAAGAGVSGNGPITWETQIVDGTKTKQLACMGREDGEGFVTAIRISQHDACSPEKEFQTVSGYRIAAARFKLIWAYRIITAGATTKHSSRECTIDLRICRQPRHGIRLSVLWSGGSVKRW
ncbi:MAG: hypothetical protein R2861_14030 [Desulfobacterales bacterium]